MFNFSSAILNMISKQLLIFMRGRTLSEAFVILDEAQNTTPDQMKMFLTRLGPGSRAVINGDVTQIDLGPNAKSGLIEASQILVDPSDDQRIYMLNSYSFSDDGGRTFRSPGQSLHGDDRFVDLSDAYDGGLRGQIEAAAGRLGPREWHRR